MAFIVFEGIDGAGKSSLISKFSNYLEAQGINFVVTREPGGTELSDEIRRLLLRTDAEVPVPKAELLLYAAGRAQHVEKFIRPHLKTHWVLCDRFTASTVAFQSAGRNLDPKKIQWLNDFATSGLTPDVTVLLDLTPEESQKRRQNRETEQNQAQDRFEQEPQEFHTKVRNSYLEQVQAAPEKWIVINASHTPDEIFVELLQKLKEGNWLTS